MAPHDYMEELLKDDPVLRGFEQLEDLIEKKYEPLVSERRGRSDDEQVISKTAAKIYHGLGKIANPKNWRKERQEEKEALEEVYQSLRAIDGEMHEIFHGKTPYRNACNAVEYWNKLVDERSEGHHNLHARVLEVAIKKTKCYIETAQHLERFSQILQDRLTAFVWEEYSKTEEGQIDENILDPRQGYSIEAIKKFGQGYQRTITQLNQLRRNRGKLPDGIDYKQIFPMVMSDLQTEYRAFMADPIHYLYGPDDPVVDPEPTPVKKVAKKKAVKKTSASPKKKAAKKKVSSSAKKKSSKKKTSKKKRA